ncbi:MAG: rhomboid family intramembrane serine protease [Candidatus Bathyarchaeia archaeon]
MGGENRGNANITYLIILVNWGVFLYMFSSRMGFLQVLNDYGLIPTLFLRRFDTLNLLSYMFLHSDLSHLLVNSLALWGIGIIVEREINSPYFLLLYIASGVVSGLGHVALNPSSNVPLVGASGAIFGILAILFLLMPYKFTMLLIIPLPSVIVGLIMVAMELSAFLYRRDPYIAHDAHLTGFIFGCLSSFIIDHKKAFRGLIIALAVSLGLYMIGVYYQLF